MHSNTDGTRRRDALSTTFSTRGSQCITVRRYDGAGVRQRRVFHPELATFFTKLREARGIGFRQAVALAARRGLSALTHQTLRGLEKGTTKNPEPEVLQALARLYAIPYEEVLTRYIDCRYRTVDHESEALSAELEHGQVVAPGSDRTEREDRLLLEGPIFPLAGLHGDQTLAATHAALERVRAKQADALSDLVALINRVARGQTTVARAPGSEHPGRARKRRRRPARKGATKPPARR